MPIYEYNCPDCGAEFETLVKNAKEKVVCPKCGQKKSKRLMSASAFRCGAGLSYPKSLQGGPSSGCGSCAASSCDGCGSK